MALSDDKIDVVCMGMPSQNVVDSMLRSIGTARRGINKKTCINPVAISKDRAGDAASLARTLGKKDVSKAILAAIRRSSSVKSFTVQDYIVILCRDMSAQIPQVGKLVQAANDIASEVDDAYKELEGNHKLSALKKAVESFVVAMIKYRDSVLKDIVVARIMAAEDNSSKVAKSTEWGGKKPWQKAPGSAGTSSRMSTVTEDVGGNPYFPIEEAELKELVRKGLNLKWRVEKDDCNFAEVMAMAGYEDLFNDSVVAHTRSCQGIDRVKTAMKKKSLASCKQ